MFTAEFVAYLRNKPAGVPYISELMRAVQRRRTEDNVIMNVLTIGMCCHNEGMLSVKKTLRQLIANLICFLRRHFTWLKRLPELIRNHFAFLSTADVHKILIPGKNKLLIR